MSDSMWQVSRVIRRYKEVLQALKVLIVSFRDNFFFYWRCLVRIIKFDKNEQVGMSNSLLSLELYSSTLSIANLSTNSQSIQIASCSIYKFLSIVLLKLS